MSTKRNTILVILAKSNIEITSCKENIQKWAWFTKVYSPKYNVSGVLNGNGKLQKFLPQAVSSLKVLSIHVCPKTRKSHPCPQKYLATCLKFLYLLFPMLQWCFSGNLTDRYAERLIYEDIHIFLFLHLFYLLFSCRDPWDVAILNTRTVW